MKQKADNNIPQRELGMDGWFGWMDGGIGPLELKPFTLGIVHSSSWDFLTASASRLQDHQRQSVDPGGNSKRWPRRRYQHDGLQ